MTKPFTNEYDSPSPMTLDTHIIYYLFDYNSILFRILAFQPRTMSNTLKPIEDHQLFDDEKYGHLMATLKGCHFKECKRDGNCLYRAIAILIFPLLESEAFRSIFLSFKEDFENAGFSSVVYEWYIESIEEMVASKAGCELAEEDGLLLIAYLRMVCSSEAQARRETYQDFIEQDVKKYCQCSIEPMELRAGDFEISVLSNALKLRIEVVSLVSDDLEEIGRVLYGEGDVKLQILHTPDHFEPFYG